MGRDTGLDDALAGGQKPTEKPRKRKGGSSPPQAPTPIATSGIPASKGFPIEVFPPRCRAFALAVADAVQVPVDIPALGMLVVAGSAIGSTRMFAFRPDWHASSTLFGAVVVSSGTGKSPALRHVIRPLRQAQKFSQLEFKEYNSIFAHLLSEATTNNTEPPRELERPTRYLVDDTTLEALMLLMSRHPRGLLSWNDELAGWVAAMDQYRAGKGTDRNRWLSIYDGEPISVDRKGDGELLISNPSISLLGAIQPSRLYLLADKELREDGLIPRFLFCNPQGVRDDLPYKDAPVPDEHIHAWRETVFALLRLTHWHGGTEPRIVQPSHKVKDVYREWFDANSLEMQHSDFNPELRPTWCKFRTTILRIALILHELRVQDQDVNATELIPVTIADAVKVIDWAKIQARSIRQDINADGIARQIERLTLWLTRRFEADKDGVRRVTARLVQRSNVAGVKSVTEAVKLFRAAADRGIGMFDQKSSEFIYKEICQPSESETENTPSPSDGKGSP